MASLGDLQSDEIARIQRVANSLDTIIFVVGSAAKGLRRNVGTDLPLKKDWSSTVPKAKTRSDIDYMMQNGTLVRNRGRADDLVAFATRSLPDVDAAFGLLDMSPGDYLNLGSSPAVMFRPHRQPVCLPQGGTRTTGVHVVFTGLAGMAGVRCSDPTICALINS